MPWNSPRAAGIFTGAALLLSPPLPGHTKPAKAPPRPTQTVRKSKSAKPQGVTLPKPPPPLKPADNALFNAVLQGDAPAVKKALDDGANANLKRPEPLLTWAAKIQRVGRKIVDLLIAYGAQVNAVQPDGTTALSAAASYRNTDAVRALLDAGADPNVGDSPLVLAAMMGGDEDDPSLVQLLLKHGAKVNVIGGLHETALMAAAKNGAVETVRVLLDHGADPNTKTQYGTTALIAMGTEAALDRRLAAEYALTDPDVPAEAKAAVKKLIAAWPGKDAAIVKMLLAHGAAMDARDTRGDTALTSAAESGNAAVTEALLSAGDKPEQRGRDGLTPLMLAAGHGHADVVTALLRRGASTEATAAGGATACALARLEGFDETARALKAAGAKDVSVPATVPAPTSGYSVTDLGPIENFFPMHRPHALNDTAGLNNRGEVSGWTVAPSAPGTPLGAREKDAAMLYLDGAWKEIGPGRPSFLGNGGRVLLDAQPSMYWGVRPGRIGLQLWKDGKAHPTKDIFWIRILDLTQREGERRLDSNVRGDILFPKDRRMLLRTSAKTVDTGIALGGSAADRAALADDGTAVVYVALDFVTGKGKRFDVWTWKHGKKTLLGGGSRENFFASAVNTHGEVVGSRRIGDKWLPYIWKKGAFQALTVPTGFNIYNVGDINARGDEIGTAEYNTNRPGSIAEYRSQSLLWRNGRLVDMDTLLPAASGWKDPMLQFLNDKGQIAGWALRYGQPHAFLLTPEPEIGTVDAGGK
jgi:ankyrin repeat protein